MEAFIPSRSTSHARVVSPLASQELGALDPYGAPGGRCRSSRWMQAIRDGFIRFRRRTLRMHDAVGRVTGWRAIYDEDEGVWDFYDEVGHYCVAAYLNDRPRPSTIDFIATIYNQGFEAGSRPKLNAKVLGEMRARATAAWRRTAANTPRSAGQPSISVRNSARTTGRRAPKGAS